MGACYSVVIKIRSQNERGVISATRDYAEACNCLSEMATDSIDEIVHFLLADHQSPVYKTERDGWTCYDNAFSASYGWEYIMLDWFRAVAQFLEDDSALIVYPDSGRDELIVRNGEAITIR